MIEVNLLGAITATEVFLDQLRDGGGDLVNISSVAGRTARPGNAVYAATKWGINGWSESLRQELQPDVRVIVIEPGAVATELTDHITDAETKAAAEQMYERPRSPRRTSPRSSPSPSHARSSVSLNEILIRPTAQALMPTAKHTSVSFDQRLGSSPKIATTRDGAALAHFELAADAMAAIDGPDTGPRGGLGPDATTWRPSAARSARPESCRLGQRH